MLWIFLFLPLFVPRWLRLQVWNPGDCSLVSPPDHWRHWRSLSSAADSCRNYTRLLNESPPSILSCLINGETKDLISLWLVDWSDSTSSLQLCDIFVSLLPTPLLSFFTTAVIWRRCAAIRGILVSHISPFKFLFHWFYFEAEGWRIKKKRKKFLETSLKKKERKKRENIGSSRCSNSWFQAQFTHCSPCYGPFLCFSSERSSTRGCSLCLKEVHG